MIEKMAANTSIKIFLLMIGVSFVFLGFKISGQPVFKVSQRSLSTKEVIDICIAGNFDAKKVCSRVPDGVTESI